MLPSLNHTCCAISHTAESLCSADAVRQNWPSMLLCPSLSRTPPDHRRRRCSARSSLVTSPMYHSRPGATSSTFRHGYRGCRQNRRCHEDFQSNGGAMSVPFSATV